MIFQSFESVFLGLGTKHRGRISYRIMLKITVPLVIYVANCLEGVTFDLNCLPFA